MKYKSTFILIVVCILLSGCSAKDLMEQVTEKSNCYFYEQQLFAPDFDKGTFWRIPAILQLRDGTLLVVNDKRNGSENDLPGDIDIVERRSYDSGRTWTEYQTIASNPSQKGYGDPAIVECSDGTLICMFCGDNGLYESTESDPINLYYIKSNDAGLTWSKPIKITSSIYGSASFYPDCKKYSSGFIASGNGICIQHSPYKGRILFVAALGAYASNNKVQSDYYLDNYVVYSDDNGATWHVSKCAFENGDEGKIVELEDGRLLMSIRQEGARGFNLSADGGITWGKQGYWTDMITNDCNGDILKFTNNNKEVVLIHSLPNSMNRENVSIFLSYDNGVTWGGPVSLCKGLSCYSSLTILKDGSIGAYIEKVGKRGNIELWFQNFTYEWLISQR